MNILLDNDTETLPDAVRPAERPNPLVLSAAPPPPRVTIFALSGEVDYASRAAPFDRLDAFARAGEAELVLDTTGVTHLDSGGMERLVNLNRLCRASGRALVVVPGAYVERLLRKTGLVRWLTTARDHDHARSLAAAASEAAAGAPGETLRSLERFGGLRLAA